MQVDPRLDAGPLEEGPNESPANYVLTFDGDNYVRSKSDEIREPWHMSLITSRPVSLQLHSSVPRYFASCIPVDGRQQSSAIGDWP
jgi:hypothetical protein